MQNFKELEPEDICPPNLKDELISEIDLIRNSLRVTELYVGDFLNVISQMFSSPVSPTTVDE
ncbi:hypothetical protein [Rudanella lutea]|uniref:hypothetical protein n=1 Tax=Rudanella lutea TaxID=451374 RepID=UPI0003653B89|nr:hypothetical protein [Rudanella lutea]